MSSMAKNSTSLSREFYLFLISAKHLLPCSPSSSNVPSPRDGHYLSMFEETLLGTVQFHLIQSFFFFLSVFGCATWHVGSSFPNQGSNQHPLHWKLRVFTTRPPWKTLSAALLSEVSVTHSQPWSKMLSGKFQK